MDNHNVKISSMDRAAYQMLVPEYTQMKNMLDLLDSTKVGSPSVSLAFAMCGPVLTSDMLW
eukprot:3613343-Rhodomonas_salina.2